MGNSCCGLRQSSSMVWAADDDDWASHSVSSSDASVPNKPVLLLEEKQSLLGFQKNYKQSSSSSSASASANKEVKIKISKKQLEELLARGNVQDIPVEQVLSRLMKASDQFEIHYQRSWRPVLQTIPELN